MLNTEPGWWDTALLEDATGWRQHNSGGWTRAGRRGETGGMQAQDKNKEQCDSSYGCGCLDAWRSSERTRGCCYRALCSGSEKISLWVIISWWRVGLGHPTVIRKWVLLSWSISWSPKIANRGFYRRLGSLTSARRPPHGDARNLGGFWRVGRKKCAGLTNRGNTVLDLLRVPLYFYFDTSTFPETCIRISGGWL